jgi:hypothetical protein
LIIWLRFIDTGTVYIIPSVKKPPHLLVLNLFFFWSKLKKNYNYNTFLILFFLKETKNKNKKKHLKQILYK